MRTASLHIGGIQRSRDSDKDIRSVEFIRKVRFDVDFVGDARAGVFCYYRVDSEGEMDIGCCAVSGMLVHRPDTTHEFAGGHLDS